MRAPLIISLLSLAFALIALGLNFLTFRDRRKQDRRDLFLKMHERLVDPDIQFGRRLIYEKVESQKHAANLRQFHPEQYQSINRALAMFDIFAMYVERGYISREIAFEEWGHSFARAYQRAAPLIADRDADQSWRAWPHLRSFGDDCVAWRAARLAEAEGLPTSALRGPSRPS